jgi:hypothetical protein
MFIALAPETDVFMITEHKLKVKILSMFYACVFGTNFLAPKLQTQIKAL